MKQRPSFDTKFLVGIEQIDREHQRLFELLAKIHDALVANQERNEPLIRSAAVELLEYANTHFANEEAKMSAMAYPALAAHQALHRGLLAKVRDIEIRAEFDVRYGLAELGAFVYDWLANHILVQDMAFGAFSRGANRVGTDGL